jgi:uncharacterized membrane protein
MSRNARICALFFSGSAIAMILIATAATWALAHGAPRWIAWPFRFVCHGIPSRCFVLWGIAMPICARCSGVYAGIAIGCALFAIAPFLRRRLFPSLLAIAMLIPLALDGTTQLFGLRESTNGLRVVTGLLAGGAILWVLSRVETHPEPAKPGERDGTDLSF